MLEHRGDIALVASTIWTSFAHRCRAFHDQGLTIDRPVRRLLKRIMFDNLKGNLPGIGAGKFQPRLYSGLRDNLSDLHFPSGL